MKTDISEFMYAKIMDVHVSFYFGEIKETHEKDIESLCWMKIHNIIT